MTTKKFILSIVAFFALTLNSLTVNAQSWKGISFKPEVIVKKTIEEAGRVYDRVEAEAERTPGNTGKILEDGFKAVFTYEDDGKPINWGSYTPADYRVIHQESNGRVTIRVDRKCKLQLCDYYGDCGRIFIAYPGETFRCFRSQSWTINQEGDNDGWVEQ